MSNVVNSSRADKEFEFKALEQIEQASELNSDVLVFIGGNSQGCDRRQKSIFDLVNHCHKKGIRAYWYKTPHNARLDIVDQIIPGASYVIFDLDAMSISGLIKQ